MPKFQDNYPKTEYQRSDFITDTKIIRDLIFAIQQATIMQVWLIATNYKTHVLNRSPSSARSLWMDFKDYILMPIRIRRQAKRLMRRQTI